MQSQHISEHRWEHRLILIFAPQPDHPLLQSQLELLEGQEAALQDRKLKVYQVLPDRYQAGFSKASDWKARENPYLKRRHPQAAFEIQLIGLDGGIKSAHSQPINPQRFMDLIDSMPMRQAELRRRKP
ncbi:MAG: DUF4174 domain-containing protein [Bacteroidota bacterium]